MPTYEYECRACQHQFELLQSMKDKPVKKCPQCGKQKAERLISAGAGIIFKGSGFYETDYKRAGEKRPDEKGEKSEKKNDVAAVATPEKSGVAENVKTDSAKTATTKAVSEPAKKSAPEAKANNDPKK